ncbi:hypothetical protein GCM10011413_05210 [Pedobacter psychrotolerans]|nr:hypothetical protein GCM10011413_05210 [Pedobacter psychrotolerans]
MSFYLSIICTLFFSCKTKEQKANKFVGDFNKIMEHNPPTAVVSSKAYYVNGSEVTISAGFNYVENQFESKITEDTAPEIFINIINSIPSGKDIYNDGVKFNLNLYDKNRVKFAETTISKQTEEKTQI